MSIAPEPVTKRCKGALNRPVRYGEADRRPLIGVENAPRMLPDIKEAGIRVANSERVFIGRAGAEGVSGAVPAEPVETLQEIGCQIVNSDFVEEQEIDVISSQPAQGLGQ